MWADMRWYMQLIGQSEVNNLSCSDLRLVVVLQWHGDDVDADDEGDEEVQVVAGA